MSVDLDMKIRKDGLVVADVLKAISSRWDALRTGEALTILNRRDLNLEEVVNSETPPVDIEATDEAYVRCLFYDVEQWPPDSDDDEECGSRVCVSAGIRNKETFLLMSVAAAALADLAGSKIIDERGLAGLGRIVRAEDLLEKINRLSGMGLTDAANAFIPG